MKKAFFLVTILCLSVFSTACINNFAVQELNNKAMEFMNKGDYENAISRLKSSVDLDDTIFESQYNLAVAYTNAEDYDNAIETFKKAITLNSSFADVYYSYAVAQDNYAKDILAGTSKKQQEMAKDNDKVEFETMSDEPKDYKPTAEEKNEAITLYTGAVENYELYLKHASSSKDTAEVQEKITQLKAEIDKLSMPNEVVQ